MRLNAKIPCNLFVRKMQIYSQKLKNIVSKKVGVSFVSAFANGLIFNLEHNPLSFGGFRFGLFEKESKIASSNSFSPE